MVKQFKARLICWQCDGVPQLREPEGLQPNIYLQADKSSTPYFTSAVIVYCNAIKERLMNCLINYYSTQLP